MVMSPKKTSVGEDRHNSETQWISMVKVALRFFGMLLSNKLFMLFVFASHDPSFKNRVPVMVGWWEW